ncbi:MAG: acetoacetate decarboxylase family protein [Actinobacteria bacterium]|nr:acetoacetate decarboxylase family protein [Actinomycetota bacterium]
MHPATVPATTAEVLGRTITFPVRIRTARLNAAVFRAASDVATTCLPPGLTPVLIAPGTTLVAVLVVDYSDNDLGDYDELGITVPCLPSGSAQPSLGELLGGLRSGAMGTYVIHLPVTQEFTRAAGNQLWGLPKTVDDLAVRRSDRVVTCSWRRDEREIARVALPSRPGGQDVGVEVVGYAGSPDGLIATYSRMALSGVSLHAGGRIRFGDHPVGRELARLFRSDRAIASVAVENFACEIDPAVPLAT